MRFFIKSFGCQMNSYDSLRISDMLVERGFEVARSTNDANILIFNTCSIREKADEKLFSELGRVRPLKEQALLNGEDFIIIVTGCISQVQPTDILKRAPYVDIVLGPQDIHKILESIDNILKKNSDDKAIVSTELDANTKFSHLSEQFFNRGTSEFLTIQEGCNNFCTYCIVPFSRGREFSRDAADIISEAKKLTDNGVKEITLLGQNVNSYLGKGIDGKSWNLTRLLYSLAELDGLKRLRYLTSNPQDVDESIAKAHMEIDILMPHMHIPAQSGSDEVLKRMNRKYTVDEYYKCIDMLRNYRNNIAFSSDFIVGFPGESERDFKNTLKFVEKIKFAQAYSFKYSPRQKTAAANMPDQIPEKTKSDRLKVLQNVLNEHQRQFNQSFVGKNLNVLFVKDGRYKNQLIGRSEYSQSVTICNNSLSVGDVARIKITENAAFSLIGAID